MTHFKVHELVCPHVYKKYGDRSLMFADPRLLEWLEWFRNAIGRAVIINTYGGGGKYNQRGYRCNVCPIVMDKTIDNDMYLSAHTRFQAVDFSVNDMSDAEVRVWIMNHAKEMPYRIRMEKDTVGWTHIDVAVDPKKAELITYFSA